MKNNKFIIICFVFIFCIVSSLTIGYSAFNTSLSISGEAMVRRDADVRITNLELVDCQNGAYEKFSSQYSKSLTSMSVVLPNTNSSITYRVTVTNKTSKYFTPGEIKPVNTLPSNISYSLDGIESFGFYKGNSLTFLIKINTTSTNQELNLTLSYDFKIIDETVWNYSFTGSPQIFNVLYNANYKIEAWGATGGGAGVANGGYVQGNISLTKGKTLYVYVGGAGINYGTNTPVGGYNGGGNAVAHTNFSHGSTGGGATDVRTVSGNWDNFDSLKSRIIVAAGGGGGADESYNSLGFKAGQAGGLQGYTAYDTSYPTNQGKGGSQTSGGELPVFHSCSPSGGTTVGGFGFGGDGGKNGNSNTTGGGSGGGAGYYGGSGSSGLCNGTWAGGGGSSFISGHDGCNAISSSSTASNIVHLNSPDHYSGLKFSSTVMIDGKGCKWTNELTSDCSGQTQPDGSVTLGHSGDGYVRITLLTNN